MAQKLTLRYDRIGDILYVETCLPYATQESDCLPDEIVGRYNPDTGELEGMEILFFSRRFPKGGRASRVVGMELPFDVKGPKADPPFTRPSRTKPAVRRGKSRRKVAAARA
jgi:hypothetical protein